MARSFRLADEALQRFDPSELATAMGAVFDFAKLRFQREMEAGELGRPDHQHDALLALKEFNLSVADRERLVERLRAVVDEFDALDRGEAGEGPSVSVFIATHPVHAG